MVMDSSDPHHEMHRKITEDTLKDLDAIAIPRLYVYNKADIRDPDLSIANSPERDSVYISAKTGYGMDDLLDKICEMLSPASRTIDVVIPYTAGGLLSRLHDNSQIISESFEEGGTHIRAICPAALADSIESAATDFCI